MISTRLWVTARWSKLEDSRREREETGEAGAEGA